jgi:amino acid adenylation domain-containing protein
MNMITDHIPLHPAQSVVYMDYLFSKSREKFNIGGCVKFNRKLDYAALIRANEKFCWANGSSRMIITEHNGNIIQKISQSSAVAEIECLDFSRVTDPAIDAEQWIQGRMDCPMEVMNAPLVEQALIKIADNEYWYFLKQHHIAADAYSFANRINHFLKLLAGEDTAYPVEDTDYVNEIQQSLSYLQSEEYDCDQNYWRGKLCELDFLRGKNYSCRNKSLAKSSFTIAAHTQAKIKVTADQRGLTEQVIINSVLLQHISAWLGRSSLVVGFPSHNRVYKRQKKLYGMFATILPVIIPVSGCSSLKDFSYLLKQEQHFSYLHRRYSWVDIVNNLLVGEEVINSFFDVIISYQKIDLQLKESFPGVTLKEYTSSRDDIPLRVIIRDYSADALEVSVEYQRALFSVQDVTRLITSITNGFNVFDQVFSAPLSVYHQVTGIDSFNDAFRYWRNFPHSYAAPIAVGSNYDDGKVIGEGLVWGSRSLAVNTYLPKNDLFSLWVLFIAKLYDIELLYVLHSSLGVASTSPFTEKRLLSIALENSLPVNDVVAAISRQLQKSLAEEPPLLDRVLACYSSYPAIAHTFIVDGCEPSNDLEMNVGELGLHWCDNKGIEIYFDPAHLSAVDITHLANCFLNIINNTSTSPSLSLAQISLLSPADIKVLNQSITDNYVTHPVIDTIYETFYENVIAYPDHPAIVHDNRRETYSSLSANVDIIANGLLCLGLIKGDVLAVHLERGVDLVVCIIAALKIGAIYLPLDDKSPLARLHSIVTDAEPKIIITRSTIFNDMDVTLADPAALYGDQKIVSLPSYKNVTPDDAAYLLYTSGSTGRPKGVLQSHRNVLQLLNATRTTFNFNHSDVWVLFHSIAFDFSVWELWGALLHGGTLVIPSYECTRDSSNFLALVENAQVTVLNQTPSAFKLLLGELANKDYSLEKLRYVVFGGEKLDPACLAPWWVLNRGRNATLVNMFGITETTVHSTYKVMDRAAQRHSNIGRFLSDQRPYVLDSHMNMVPDNIVGELYVGGDRLALEYFKNDQLTDERFVSNPYSADPEDRLYRTGDLVKRLPNGEFIYHSRKDFQVSLRGFRIELGEIENAMLKHPHVKDVVVRLLQNSDEKFIVAFYEVNNNLSGWNHNLYDFLKEKLPDYMIPERYIQVDSWPLTINGKVDFGALDLMAKSSPTNASVGTNLVWQGSSSLIQHLLQAYVKVDITSSDLSLYNFGWNSLSAIKFSAELRELFGIDIPIVVLLESPTLNKIIASIHRLIGDDTLNRIADEYFNLLEMTDEQLQSMCD